jgi:hypothetical protein
MVATSAEYGNDKKTLPFFPLLMFSLILWSIGCGTTTSTIDDSFNLDIMLIQRLLEDCESDSNSTENNTIENEILQKFLSSLNEHDGNIIVISPTTISEFIDVNSPYTAGYLSEWSSNVTECDIFALVDKYNEINKDSELLTIKSSLTEGYYVNFDNKLEKYLAELRGGYYDEEENCICINTDDGGVIYMYTGGSWWGYDLKRFQKRFDVSIPAYDPITGYVLIYSYCEDRVSIEGTMNLMKYEDGILSKVKSEYLISGTRSWVDTRTE